MAYSNWGWQPYVSAAARRLAAARERAALEKAGRKLAPVVISGRAIARTFWGAAWCRNLELYSDYDNRLPRGRSYVRNGLVLHLEMSAGAVEALVRGTSLYTVQVKIAPVPKTRWASICKENAGAIDSLIELLQGRLSDAVGERICRQESGLFPSPKEISFSCTCPDGASMCKHVAAVLYGVGARLDAEPQLLFALRKVNEHDLVATADSGTRLAKRDPGKGKVLAGANLSELFGLQMGTTAGGGAPKRSMPKRSMPKRSTPKRSTPNDARGRRQARGKAVATRKSTAKPAAKSSRGARKGAPGKRAQPLRVRGG